MQETICPECEVRADVDAADVGQRVECPACGSTYLAVAVPAERPRKRSLGRERDERARDRCDNDYNDPDFMLRRARRDLKPMGIAIVVIGLVNLLAGLFLVVFGAFAPQAFGDARPDPGCIAAGVASLVLGIVQVMGGRQMNRVKHYGLCVAAAILSIPPCSPGNFFAVGMLFGIIALMTLLKPDVRRAFRVDNPDGDVE